MSKRMTYDEAIKLLHPDTTRQALAEIEYYNGFNGKQAKIEAINQACLLACETMEEMKKLEDDLK